MCLEPPRDRWTWNYESEAKQLGWPADYDQIPRKRQPLLLASCYLVGPDAMHVYVRSGLRLQKALLFFDQRIPRSCAKGEFIDEYNLATAIARGQPLPQPEDYFRDESKFVLEDPEAMLKRSGTWEELIDQSRRQTLAAFERHSLEAFYEDGPQYLETAMRMREILAMKQHQSSKPIRPFDVYEKIFSGLDGGRPETSSSPLSSRPQTEVIEISQTRPQAARLSFEEPDSPPGQPVTLLELPEGKRRYALEFSACPNPVCSCRTLEISLRSTDGGEDAESALTVAFEQDAARIEHSPEAEKLAAALERRFSSEDWPALYQIFLNLKARCSEISDASEASTQFPEDILADPSCMLAYKRVFQWSADLRFDLNGASWIALERYCTNPDCDCSSALLDCRLFPETSPDHSHEKSKEAALILLDFETGAWRVRKNGPAGTPSPRELIAALQTAYPDWQTRFKRRHQVLRQMHQRARESTGLPTAASRQAPQPRKIGRNEKCPCGSGKKYKHCCGGAR